jgi:phage terminase large subunit-like protein
MKADRAFCVIYAGTEDDKDRRFDSRVLERINPMWGVSLNPVTIEEEEREARKSEEKLQEYYRTRLNIWSRAAGNLLSVEDWERCSDRRLNLDLFKGYPLFVGLDLASKSDLNAASFITSLDGCVYSTAKYWLPEHAKRFADDRFADQFIKWREDGYLNATPGKVIDYEKILEEVLAQIEGHNVMGIGLDEYQANYLAKKFEDRGYPVFILPKRAKYVTTSTDDLIARTADPDLFQNDGNPVTKWCAGNVVGHYDANSNVLPKKEKPNSKANIDGIDALIIANAMRIDWEAGTLGDPDKGNTVPMVYMQRGLAGVA